MINVINPQKEFKSTPNKFSSVSKVVDIEKKDCRRGVILDSIKELEHAILVYDGYEVPESGATQRNLTKAIGEQSGGVGVALLAFSGAKISSGFTGRLIENMKATLASRDGFNESFDYDAMGTNFFKTTVGVQRVEDKYVLELNAAYVGTKPEENLAVKLQKPSGLVSSSVYGKLSIVDGWWFNFNLKEMLEKLPINKKQLAGIKEYGEYIASGGYRGKENEVELEYKGNKFILSFGIDSNRHLKPDNAERGVYYIQARGDSIVGGAWITYDEKGRDIQPTAKQPSIVLSVSLPGERYCRKPAVTSEKMKSLQDARDCLASFLK